MVVRRCVALLVASAAGFAASGQVHFYGVGVPADSDPQNPPFTDAYAVTDDGVVVGSMHDASQGFVSFRWSVGGGRTQIKGLTPTSGIYARAITPDGKVFAGENTNPNTAIRSVNGVLENLDYDDHDLYDQSAGYDLSNDGKYVGGLLSRIEDGTYRAARWHEGSGWQDLGVLSNDDYESVGNAISGDGSIVAGYSVGNRFNAFKWTQATGMVALPNPFNIVSDTAVIAMAADGSRYVGQARDAQGRTQAGFWNSDGTSGALALLSGYDSASAFGVSGDGSIVGGTFFIDGVGADIAAFWTGDGTAYDLKAYLVANGIDMTGWTLTAITEVSQNGLYLTGRGINPEGYMEAFMVQIPTPGGTTVMLAGLGLASRRRRTGSC